MKFASQSSDKLWGVARHRRVSQVIIGCCMFLGDVRNAVSMLIDEKCCLAFFEMFLKCFSAEPNPHYLGVTTWRIGLNWRSRRRDLIFHWKGPESVAILKIFFF